jgi:hypothetical protein
MSHRGGARARTPAAGAAGGGRTAVEQVPEVLGERADAHLAALLCVMRLSRRRRRLRRRIRCGRPGQRRMKRFRSGVLESEATRFTGCHEVLLKSRSANNKTERPLVMRSKSSSRRRKGCCTVFTERQLDAKRYQSTTNHLEPDHINEKISSMCGAMP